MADTARKMILDKTTT